MIEIKKFFKELYPYEKFTLWNLFKMLPIYILLLAAIVALIMVCQLLVICIIDIIFSTQCVEAVFPVALPFIIIALLFMAIVITIMTFID